MDPSPVAKPRPGLIAGLVHLLERVRPEDWFLAGWIAIVSPLLGVAQGGGPRPGPFDGGQPLDGAFRLAAVLAALVCLVTRSSDGPADGPGVLQRGAIGPLTGGLLLVGVSGASALELSDTAGKVLIVAGVIATIVVRLRWPALPTIVRRALVTPFVLAAGGIFWTIVDSISGGGSLAGSFGGAGSDAGSVVFAAGALLAFAGVYYAMLVYAPRQVAEAEGGIGAWLARFGLFIVSVGLGVAWLRPFGM